MNYRQWERSSEWPLAASALTFLAIYSWTVLSQPTGTVAQVAEYAIIAIWALFGIDYIVRLTLAEHRTRWVVRHLHELAIVALPVLRPLRLLRLLTLVSLLQRSIGGALRGRVVTYAVAGTLLLVFVASLAMFDAERAEPAATIKTFPDALWWAIATVTTVGYGDFSPSTATGRFIAVGLMVAGIALLGVVTATLASWLVQKVAEQDDVNQAATQRQVTELTSQIAALRTELALRSEGLGTAASTTPDSAGQIDTH
ncbi:two pore domain potassium channel family protein [Rhodococcus fascians]|nr:two pore domain potassium channel family protein [Rhodococcus fascians]MBY3998223.1 two pore domain potassium channel family protein [Rhodococcus fascians]MBY4004391.1 two pore domain potassium channel family protein [Rhodococcus fascians]MBY4009036.1 two pore domain potassium channel family protein [Rhodococcus fascians]MBY4019598.1 two pore domain potassium channel family protein [Rhodococcus fascians]